MLLAEIMSEHSIPDRIFRNSTLFVAVDHSIYANELSLNEATLLFKNITGKVCLLSMIKKVKAEVKKIKMEKKIITGK